jgi:voltage-gated potassium channel Kch
LVEAGIEKAKGLVAVVSSDPQNVYISLTARGLSTLLNILSRAGDEATEKKLIRAGANFVSKVNEFVKSQNWDSKVKSSKCKACEL